MVTDDERRRVAAALRAYAETPAPWHLADVLDNVLNETGDHDKIVRLADLIEPNCDREALLALTRTLEEFDRPEMDDCTRCPVERADECATGSTCQNMARWCARRIREACGVIE